MLIPYLSNNSQKKVLIFIDSAAFTQIPESEIWILACASSLLHFLFCFASANWVTFHNLHILFTSLFPTPLYTPCLYWECQCCFCPPGRFLIPQCFLLYQLFFRLSRAPPSSGLLSTSISIVSPLLYMVILGTWALPSGYRSSGWHCWITRQKDLLLLDIFKLAL